MAKCVREFCIDNLLVRIHIIIVIITWTGLVPWEFEFPFVDQTARAGCGKAAGGGKEAQFRAGRGGRSDQPDPQLGADHFFLLLFYSQA